MSAYRNSVQKGQNDVERANSEHFSNKHHYHYKNVEDQFTIADKQSEFRAPSEHPKNIDKLAMYPTPSQRDKTNQKAELKAEIIKLLQMLKTVDCNAELIYEEENVVEQLGRIEEFFDEICDNLSEVRDYMMTLLEYMIDDQNDDVRNIVPQLWKVIKLLRQLCPFDKQSLKFMEETPGGPTTNVTPTGDPTPGERLGRGS